MQQPYAFRVLQVHDGLKIMCRDFKGLWCQQVLLLWSSCRRVSRTDGDRKRVRGQHKLCTLFQPLNQFQQENAVDRFILLPGVFTSNWERDLRVKSKHVENWQTTNAKITSFALASTFFVLFSKYTILMLIYVGNVKLRTCTLTYSEKLILLLHLDQFALDLHRKLLDV